MKKLLLILGAFCLLATPAMAEYIYIDNYTWDVTKSNSIDIAVKVSGGSPLSLISEYFSVGDGGPLIGGTEKIQIGAVGYGAGTIWSGLTLDPSSGPTDSLPTGAALNVNVQLPWTTSSHPSVSANGTLTIITLQAPPGGLASEIGQHLTLNPDLLDYTSMSFGDVPLSLTFGSGTLTLVPEPSVGMMLLSLGGALFGWRRYRSQKSRQS